MALVPGASPPELAGVALDAGPLLRAPGPHFRARGLDRLRRFEVADRDAATARRLLAAHPAVAWVEPNRVIRTHDLPDDPGLPLQWALRNTGQTGGTAGADIDAEAAWALGDAAGTLVAVLDSGVDAQHADLLGKLWAHPGEVPANGIDDDGNGYVDDVAGWDFVDDDADPDDPAGHGTHVAGIVAAVHDNGTGIAGVAPATQILPLRITDAGQVGSVGAAIEAIAYAVSAGADVIQNSWSVSEAWGEPGWDQAGFSPALRAAIDAADAAGVLFVVAAGNSALDLDVEPRFPAAYDLPNVVAVAASDDSDALAAWSNTGGSSVDLAAPGQSILSTVPPACTVMGAPPEGSAVCDGSGLLTASGTSMAAPHVSGVVALIRARFPALGHHALKARLLASTEPLPGHFGRTVSGGRLDAARALAEDDEPPGAIPDLQVTERTPFGLTVRWTAPGDDGATGTARSYALRISGAPIDEQGFAAATPVPGTPLPGPPGSSETARIGGLDPLTLYHVAVRAVDDVGNAGPLSPSVADSTPSDATCGTLAAFWSFDGETGPEAADRSCHDHHASGPAARVPGSVGEAVPLDGSEELRVAGNGLGDGLPGVAGTSATSFTIAGWVRPQTARYQMLVTKDDAGERSFNLALRSDGLLEAQLFTPGPVVLVGTSPLPLFTWSHFALVHDLVGGEATLYVDGEPAGSVAVSAPLSASSADWVLGARALAASPNRLEGDLDEVAVFAEALDDAEVAHLLVPQCGNRLPEGGEACDDGNQDELDGCSAACEFSRHFALLGLAEGGSLTVVVDERSFVLPTFPGQQGASVLAQAVVAINADPVLQQLGTGAWLDDGVLVTNGLITGLDVDDPGLGVTTAVPVPVPVPALGPTGALVGGLLLGGLGVLAARRRV